MVRFGKVWTLNSEFKGVGTIVFRFIDQNNNNSCLRFIVNNSPKEPVSSCDSTDTNTGYLVKADDFSSISV